MSVTQKYLENAAKLSRYHVDLKDKFISVPENELDSWEDDLGTAHLVGLGFKI